MHAGGDVVALRAIASRVHRRQRRPARILGHDAAAHCAARLRDERRLRTDADRKHEHVEIEDRAAFQRRPAAVKRRDRIAEPEAQAGPGPEPQAGPEQEAEPESPQAPEAEAPQEPEAEAEAAPEPEPAPGAQAEPEPEAEPEAEAEPETETEAGAEAEPEVKAEAEAEAEYADTAADEPAGEDAAPELPPFWDGPPELPKPPKAKVGLLILYILFGLVICLPVTVALTGLALGIFVLGGAGIGLGALLASFCFLGMNVVADILLLAGAALVAAALGLLLLFFAVWFFLRGVVGFADLIIRKGRDWCYEHGEVDA